MSDLGARFVACRRWRWNLPTPVEPIDVSDLGVAVGVPDVG